MDNKFVEVDDDEETERRCSLVGTEAYIAPEVIQNKEITILSDLWSLGIIIYQIFTGKTPFKDCSTSSTF